VVAGSGLALKFKWLFLWTLMLWSGTALISTLISVCVSDDCWCSICVISRPHFDVKRKKVAINIKYCVEKLMGKVTCETFVNWRLILESV
jgi:hypothetical protein